MIEAICAISENYCLGKNNQLPWVAKADLGFFSQLTQGHAIVMGRKTYDSLKQPLTNRTNYVLTHRPIENSLVIPIKHKDQILDLPQAFIIGGLSVWQMFKNDIQRWYITNIPGIYDGDIFFDQSLLDGFSAVKMNPLSEEIIVNIYERNR